jgi:peptidyl-prolyl cis-trans isomerase C
MSADSHSPREGNRSLVKALASRAIREPLVHFFAIAVVLFAANSVLNGPERQRSGNSITISQGRVQQIAESYRLLAGRMPSRAELQALVNDFVSEEIDYREAVALGLDADDTIVRRRMRQKLEFLAEDGDGSEEPSDQQLAGWLQSHATEYRVPERISLRHVLASSDTRGPRAGADAAAMLGKLRAGTDPGKLGDASMLPAALPLTTKSGIALLFGDAFAASLFEHAREGWFGPIVSPLGAHDVLILSRQTAHDPTLAEVREKVRSDWIEARRFARREEFQARLRKRYQVSVRWPEPYASQPALADVPPLPRPLDSGYAARESEE